MLDLFSGTSRVARGLKESGRFVIANDHLSYAATLARCYVQADAARWLDEATALIDELSEVRAERPATSPKRFAKTLATCSLDNGARVDAIREEIERRALPPELEAIALCLSDGGGRPGRLHDRRSDGLPQEVGRAFLQSARASGPGPYCSGGLAKALQLEAAEAAPRRSTPTSRTSTLPTTSTATWGTTTCGRGLVRWDKPETYGIANKRVQCKEYKSDFNSKRRIHEGLREVFEHIRAKHLLVSFNNEGYVDRDEMVELLSARGHVGFVAVDFKRYVGAQIGIHNLRGEKVGQVSHLRNKEYLFVVSDRVATVESVVSVLEESLGSAALASSPPKGKREGHESERRIEG